MNYETQILMKKIEAFIGVSAKIGADLAKFSAITTLPLGMIFLIIYFRVTTAPFPLMDASISVFIGIFLITFCMIFGLLIGCVLTIVATTSFLKRSFLEEFLPHLRSDLVGPVRKLTKGFARRATVEYITLYMPFLLSIGLMCMGYIKDIYRHIIFQHAEFVLVFYKLIYNVIEYSNKSIFNIQTTEQLRNETFVLLCMFYGLPIGLSISSAIFYAKFAKAPHLIGFKKTTRKLQITSKLIMFSVAGSVVSLLWFGLAFWIMNSIIVSNFTWQAVTILLSMFIFYVHYLANASRLGTRNTFILVGFVLLMMAYITVGVTAASALALRFLGIGGLSPAKIYVKQVDPANGQNTVKVVNGCIVIATSSQIAIRETENKEDCSLRTLVLRTNNAVETYGLVDVYLRSDVFRISKWPD